MAKVKAITNMWLVVVLITLQILDFITTYIALGNGGTEANPLMLYAMEYFDTIWALLYVKVAIIIVILPFFIISVWKPKLLNTHVRQGFHDYMGWILIIVNSLYLYVVVNNIYVIYMLNTF